jgi:RecA/RadA recombinase
MIPGYISVDKDVSNFYIKNADINKKNIVMLFLSKDAEIIDAIKKLTEDNLVDLIVIDSAGLIEPSKDKKITKMVKRLLSDLSKVVYSTNCSIIFINQLIDSFEEENTKVPFCDYIFNTYASVRLKVCEADQENDSLTLEVKRNKLCNKLTQFTIYLGGNHP